MAPTPAAPAAPDRPVHRLRLLEFSKRAGEIAGIAEAVSFILEKDSDPASFIPEAVEKLKHVTQLAQSMISFEDRRAPASPPEIPDSSPAPKGLVETRVTQEDERGHYSVDVAVTLRVSGNPYLARGIFTRLPEGAAQMVAKVLESASISFSDAKKPEPTQAPAPEAVASRGADDLRPDLVEIWLGYSERKFKPIVFLSASDAHEWIRSVPHNFGKCSVKHYRQADKNAAPSPSRGELREAAQGVIDAKFTSFGKGKMKHVQDESGEMVYLVGHEAIDRLVAALQKEGEA